MVRPCARGLFVVALGLAATACDGYVEQITIGADGAVGFAAEAVVVCADELQRAIWAGDPCAAIDAASRGGEVPPLPFAFDFDPDRVGLVAEGDADRRRIDVTWEGDVGELETVLVSGGSLREIDEFTTEVVLQTAGTPAASLAATPPDGAIARAAARSQWPAAELRVVAPAIVVSHNGDDIAGRTVIWTIDGDQPETFSVRWSTEERGFRVWWWAVGAAVLGLVLMMMVVLEGQRVERR